MRANAELTLEILKESTPSERSELLRINKLTLEAARKEFGQTKQEVLNSIVKKIRDRLPLNSLCEKCAHLNQGCVGMTDLTYTGCVHRIFKAAL